MLWVLSCYIAADAGKRGVGSRGVVGESPDRPQMPLAMQPTAAGLQRAVQNDEDMQIVHLNCTEVADRICNGDVCKESIDRGE